jgi:shikimate kinase
VNILLIGLRGSGKSAVGRLLAEQLNRPFVDLDDRVLATFNEPTVAAVWSVHGEQAWRAAEARLLGELLDQSVGVIALGGGTPMIDAARCVLEAARASGTATIIYLRCDAAELQRRLTAVTGDRPSLTGADPVQETPDVLQSREPVYRRLADHEYDVSTTAPDRVAEGLRELLK